MRERSRPAEESREVDARSAARGIDRPVLPTAAVLEAAGRATEPGRGAAAVLNRAIDSLHASAGNGAIARLIEGSATRSRGGPGPLHATTIGVAGPPVLQRSADEDEAASGQAGTAADSTPSALGTGAPAHGPSWTHVGPPTPATYTVSGSLREVANAVAARPEAGSVTTTPSRVIETWTPEGGTEQITAARVTVDQVLELPKWMDKSSATPRQQAEWDRFHAAITTHEAGHVSIDKATFSGTHSQMVSQSPADGDTALDTVTTKAETDNDAYDSTTTHGLTQGTGINPNVDEVTKVP